MGDKIIITDDDKQKPDTVREEKVVVLYPQKKPEMERTVTEKTTVVKSRED